MKEDEIKKNVYSEKYEDKMKGIEAIKCEPSSSNVNLLIELLQSCEPAVRESAALALAEIGDDMAVEPLVTAIKEPSNKGYVDPLVHALCTFNCEKYFFLMVDLILHGPILAGCEALDVLREQKFRPSKNELEEAEKELKKWYQANEVQQEKKELIECLRKHLRQYKNK